MCVVLDVMLLELFFLAELSLYTRIFVVNAIVVVVLLLVHGGEGEFVGLLVGL